MPILNFTEDSNFNDWTIEGDTLFPMDGKANITSSIKPGIYRVVPSQRAMDNRIGLKRVDDKFSLGLKKIYKTGGEEVIDVMKKTWNSGKFRGKKRNLCCILVGQKGTGKTISAKILSNDFVDKLPVIIVDSDFDGRVVGLIQMIDFECVVFIDEAEKTFSERKTDLLKICDGVHCKSSKIILMTANTLDVDRNLISRPGRVRYIHRFETLPEETCREFLKDNLDDKKGIEKVYNLVNKLAFSTIDILSNIVEEYNIHQNLEIIRKYLNISLLPTKYFFIECNGVRNLEDLKFVVDWINSEKLEGENTYDFICRVNKEKSVTIGKMYDKFERQKQRDPDADEEELVNKITSIETSNPAYIYNLRTICSVCDVNLEEGAVFPDLGKIITPINKDGVFMIEDPGRCLENSDICESIDDMYIEKSLSKPRKIKATVKKDVKMIEDGITPVIFSHSQEGSNLYRSWNLKSLPWTF